MTEFFKKYKQPEGEPKQPEGEPTEEMLEPLHDMTKEEWEAKRQQWEQEMTKQKEGVERTRKERYEKWERRTKALESIQLTGDIVEDAEAFFKAAEITDLEEFDSHYGGAFSRKDHKGMLQCFKDYEKNPRAGFLPPETNEAIVRFFKTFDEAVKKIISIAESIEEKKKPEKFKE